MLLVVMQLTHGKATGPWEHLGAVSLLLLLAGLVEIVTRRCLSREVVLSVDGHLRVSGRGQNTQVDVRQLTEVRVPPAARLNLGHAEIRWAGGAIRVGPTMSYRSGPADHTGMHPGRWSSEGLRDFVYRLRLINPALEVGRIRPPSWAPPMY